MKNYFLTFFVLIAFCCNSKINSKSDFEIDYTGKKYGTEIKVFGDSLKIIYKYEGDTVFQERIDLKGISDDGFDSSFDVMSIWSTLTPTSIDCIESLTLNLDNLEFKFCLNDVILKTENDIIKNSKKPWELEGLEKLKKELLDIKNGKSKKLSQRTKYLVSNLISSVDYSVYDKKTKTKIEKIRLEKYETSFSGGRNYFFISKQNDTIGNFSITKWMK